MVGEVTAVDLQSNLDGVAIQVRLLETAAPIARAGTQFWIERPQVSLSQVRSLETLVRGQYIAVHPGPTDANAVKTFEGLEVPPAGAREKNGLEFILYSSQRMGLRRGIPLKYRGIEVGHIISVGIAADASMVEARAYVEPGYKQLVRANSRFWNDSGFDVDIGLRGISLSTDSIESMAIGSIAFATPDNAAEPARTDHRFELAAEADDDWLEWSPQIAIGSTDLPAGIATPQPMRAVVRWKYKRLGFTRTGEMNGWLLPVGGQKLIGIAELFSIPDDAIDGSATLELAGQEIKLDSASIQKAEQIATFRLPTEFNLESQPWEAKRIRKPTELENCTVVASPASNTFPISSGRLTASETAWQVDPSISVDDIFRGAPVTAGSDGHVIGFLTLDSGQARIQLAHEFATQ